jgi:hypothetical protein
MVGWFEIAVSDQLSADNFKIISNFLSRLLMAES